MHLIRKDPMKLMIASDIHGSAFYLKKLLGQYHREQPDKLLLLGDILYHGPRNALPEGYAPSEVIELLNAVKEEILCVSTRWSSNSRSLRITASCTTRDV